MLAAGLAFASFTWAVARNARRPSVVLLSLGAVRADALRSWDARSPIAPAGPLAPTLAYLCDIGVCFTQAYSNAPYARAASATVLTGGLSVQHGVRGPLDHVARSQPQLAELFAASGYDTGAIVGSYEVDSVFGFRGFSLFDGRFFEPILGHTRDPLPVPSLVFHHWGFQHSARLSKLHANARKPDRFTTDAALGFLATHHRRPFFLWVQYFGAHPAGGLETPAPFVVDRYVERVRELDRELRRLLEGLVHLGLQRRAWLFIYGDAGFSLFEHGKYGVAADLHEPAVRVPLIVVPPLTLRSSFAARRIDVPVSLRDLAPTIVDVLQLPVRVSWPSTGFAPLLRQAAPTQDFDRAVPLENYWPATAAASREVVLGTGRTARIGERLRGVRSGRWKYVLAEPSFLVDAPVLRGLSLPPSADAGQERLFDLEVDPGEERNRVALEPQVRKALRALLPEVPSELQ